MREIKDLPLEIQPPEALEEKVLNTLRRRNLIASGGHWWAAPSATSMTLATAASLAALVLGIGIGRGSVRAEDGPSTGAGAAQAETARASFILFLHAGPEFEPNSGENFPERFSAYNDWIADTRQAGQFITGEQLDDSGLMLLPARAEPLIENRVAATDDGDILGMFLINAVDYDEATRIALALPHLAFGGRVAIRRVDPI